MLLAVKHPVWLCQSDSIYVQIIAFFSLSSEYQWMP